MENCGNLATIIKDDPGIDFLNYSLKGEIQKYDGINPVNWNILVRVYVPLVETKTKGGVILPTSKIDRAHEDAKFTNLVGLALKFAPGVYKDESRYSLCGPLCKVGDWVQFTRAAGFSFAHNHLTSMYIKEDMVQSVVADPRTVSRIFVNNREA